MAKERKGAATTGSSASKDAKIRLLEARVKELEQERDGYLQTVKALLPAKRFRFTKKELKEMEENPFTLADYICDLGARLPAENANARAG